MALPAFVQAAKASAAGFPNAITTPAFGSSTTSGNAIAVYATAASSSADISSVTDSKSNTYVKLTNAAAGSVDGEWWLCQNITGGASHTVTSNDSGFLLAGLIAFEISGLTSTGTVLDASANATGAGGTLTAGPSSATTNANDIILQGGMISSVTAGTWTVGSGFSNLTTTSGSSDGYTMAAQTKVVSATGTQSGTLTQSQAGQNYTTSLVALSNTAIISNVALAPFNKMPTQAVNRASTY